MDGRILIRNIISREDERKVILCECLDCGTVLKYERSEFNYSQDKTIIKIGSKVGKECPVCHEMYKVKLEKGTKSQEEFDKCSIFERKASSVKYKASPQNLDMGRYKHITFTYDKLMTYMKQTHNTDIPIYKSLDNGGKSPFSKYWTVAGINITYDSDMNTWNVKDEVFSEGTKDLMIYCNNPDCRYHRATGKRYIQRAKITVRKDKKINLGQIPSCDFCQKRLSDELREKALAEFDKLNKPNRTPEQNIVEHKESTNNQQQIQEQAPKLNEKKEKSNKNSSQMIINSKLMDLLDSSNLEIILPKTARKTSDGKIKTDKDIQVVCSKCGEIQQMHPENANDFTKRIYTHQCKGCQNHSIGIMKQSLVGTVINGLKCIADGADSTNKLVESTIRVICTHCNESMILRKVDFVLSKAVCLNSSCGNSISYKCMNCGNDIEVSYKQIIEEQDKELVCSKCRALQYTQSTHEPVKLHILGVQIRAEDTKVERENELKDSLRYLKEKLKFNDVYKSDIAQTDRALYRGPDGTDYYSCRCMRHHKNIILTENEVHNNCHDICSRQTNMYVTNRMIEDMEIKETSKSKGNNK